MISRLIILAVLIVSSTACVAAQVPVDAMTGWDDPSPHREGFIPVGRGVRIHYLDWGGTGEPLIFLTGIGNSAHSFDELAPKLTDSYRVVAITRRGQAQSSKPREGPYDIRTLTRDIVRVMDSLRIGAAHFAAHSFGGQELTRLAIEYPERVRKLIYLDAAFDYFWSDTAYARAAAALPLLSAAPGPTPTDCVSVEAFMRFSERTFGIRIPEGEIRSTFVRYTDGRCGRQGAILDDYQNAILLGVEPQDYKSVKAPALALSAVRDSVSQEDPWMQRDSIMRASYDSVRKLYGPIDRAQRNRFDREVPNSKLVVIAGAHHWIFVSHPDRVAEEIKAFLRG